MSSNLMDEIDCASFFDQIDDLIDFPPDDNECKNIGIGGDLVNSGCCNDFPDMWNGGLPDSDDIFSNNSASDLSAEISVPYEEIAQLEWLSTFVDDSFSDAGLNLGKNEDITCPFVNKKDSSFRTSSPVSVLESSSSNSNNIPRCGPQRARSKRPRPPAFNPRPSMIQLVEMNLVQSSSSENGSELPGPEQKQKKKKQKVKEKNDEAGTNVRKCMHCEITKTPQWRAGPMGPKTLCNACGVRFKSGRLFPEYRPAASPTFIAMVHSNSHKKVLEMRSKAGPHGGVNPEDSVTNNDA